MKYRGILNCAVHVWAMQRNDWSLTLLSIQKCIFGIRHIQSEMRSSVWTVHCQYHNDASTPTSAFIYIPDGGKPVSIWKLNTGKPLSVSYQYWYNHVYPCIYSGILASILKLNTGKSLSVSYLYQYTQVRLHIQYIRDVGITGIYMKS